MCNKCGKKEASVYYKQNINGKVTEKHLCRECAEKAEASENLFDGFDSFDSMFDNMFGSMFGGFFGRRSLLSPFGGFGLAQRTLPRVDVLIDRDGEKTQTAEVPSATVQETGVDQDMKKRRELNALRSQMYEAVKSENFEKAAELRDKIHKLEKD